jgi:hypothetical protein
MSLEDDFLKFMSEHLVAFVYQCEVSRDGATTLETGYATGFILSLHGAPFWATAGHCLIELDKTIRSGAVKLVSSGFADYFGTRAKHQTTVPLHYEPDSALKIDLGSESLDYALLPLPNLIMQAFETNGIRTVHRANWEQISKLTFAEYKMLGFPADAQELDSDAPALRPVMVSIQRLNGHLVRSEGDDWFVGRIHPEARLPDIRGMSGGPIFGFRKIGERWGYHVVGIQSRWDSATRTIKGCSVPYFAERLHAVMQELIDESDSRHS